MSSATDHVVIAFVSVLHPYQQRVPKRALPDVDPLVHMLPSRTTGPGEGGGAFWERICIDALSPFPGLG